MIPKSNKILFLLGGLLIVIFLLVFIRILTFDETTAPSPIPTPIPFASPPDIGTLEPTPPLASPPAYNLEAVQRDYERIVNRGQLSSSDLNIRNSLIASLDNQSGVLTENSRFKIEYVKSPNVFMVEILSNDAEAAKDEATKWFTDQGLSQAGVCNLPVEFYLNFEVNSTYKQRGLQFNPVPEGC